MPENTLPEAKLTKSDVAANTAQALIKAIPAFGDALEQFIFGPLVELRWKRVERTLAELAEALHKTHIVGLTTEEFVNLLESVMPKIGRAVNEERRLRFRDLLINAAKLEPGSSAWEEANLTAELIDTIEGPGLAIIAALGKCKSERNTITSRPTSAVYDGEAEIVNPKGPCFRIAYEWPIVEEWARRIQEKRIIGFMSVDARGGFGGVYLTELGKFFVRWAIKNEL